MSFALITVFSAFFVTFVSAADSTCDPSKIPDFIGCIKTELMPNDNDFKTMVQNGQLQLKQCFTNNSCPAPIFDQGLENFIFPSGDKAFAAQIQQAFGSLKPDVKQCLKDQTLGKMMGYCNIDQATHMKLTAISNNKPRLNGAFGSFQAASTTIDMDTIQQIMEEIFMTKLSVATAYRTCNETNAASGAKVGACLMNFKNECQKAACPAVKKCAPSDSSCRSSFLNLRGQLCSCHKDIVDYATTIVDKARNDKTSSNQALVKMVVEGLHIKEIISNIRFCFQDTNSDVYQGLSMVENFFTNLDSDQAAVMLKSIDVKGILDTLKDVLTALHDNEFCENPCSA